MRKHIFLLASVTILIFMALTSEKKILVTTGYAVTKEELHLGRTIYQNSCRDCHENGENGAPSARNRKDWEVYLAGGIEKLLQKGKRQCPYNQPDAAHLGKLPLTSEEMEAAIAFMIRESRQ